jgi:hypothetical protein
MHYDAKGADLIVSGKPVCRIEGVTRLTTDQNGALRSLIGISEKPQSVALRLSGRPARRIVVAANQSIALAKL